MKKFVFNIYLIFLVKIASCDLNYSDVESVLEVISHNINYTLNYVMPKNNEKLVYLKEENRNHQNFGNFDFIIVGGGAAGTLLANRLSENENWNILLLEAGGYPNDFSDIPAMSGYLFNSDMNWGYYSQPQEVACLGMRDQRCVCPKGRVLGGSTVINTKMYVRGNKEDYDGWAKMGNNGWSYEEVLPFFIKTEDSHVPGDEGFHGTGGLLSVNFTESTILTNTYLDGMGELGFPTIDINGRNQIGVSKVSFTLENIIVKSAGKAFIYPVLNRKNLNVTVNAYVTKVIIDEISNMAVGVEFIKDGIAYFATSDKEVILSAGPINSPQILMLSGIGPKEELQKHQIKVIKDLPVGQNMDDHMFFTSIVIRTNQTLFNKHHDELVIDYLNNRRPLTSPLNIDSHSFFNVDNRTSSLPNIQQIYLTPLGFENGTAGAFNLDEKSAKKFQDNYNPYTDLIIVVVNLHPESKGSVILQSNNPKDFPIIFQNFFTDIRGRDLEVLHKGIKKTLELLDTQVFKEVNAKLINVVAGCEEYEEFSDDYWYCAIKHLSSTVHHHCGTTRMGTAENSSVVSSNLLVHGLNNLRVVDSGVMPLVPSANTMAPTFMIAEKGADIIKTHYVNTKLKTEL